jgi:putative FmdB family regulatory protein
MPTYRYKCSACNEELEIFHSMSEEATDCTLCKSSGTLVKQISMSPRVVKTKPAGTNRPGGLVNQYIKDVKQELKEEKERLQAKEYKK